MTLKDNSIFLAILGAMVYVIVDRVVIQVESSADLIFGSFTLPDLFFIGVGIGALFLGYLMYFKKSKPEVKVSQNDSNIQELKDETQSYKIQVKEAQRKIQELEKNPKVSHVKESGKFDEFLNDVKNGVYVLAISANSFADRQQRMIKMINERRISFTFLLPNPNSEWMKNSSDIIIDEPSRTEIIEKLKNFRKIHDSIGDNKDKIKIKLFDLPLIHSMMIIDPESKQGKMNISFFQYNVEDADKRTNITISQKNNFDLFEKHYLSYKYVDEHSQDWDFDITPFLDTHSS